MLRTACDTTMISKAVAKELDYMGVQLPIDIEWVNAIHSSYAQYVDITVRGIYEKMSYTLSRVPCVPRQPEIRHAYRTLST